MGRFVETNPLPGERALARDRRRLGGDLRPSFTEAVALVEKSPHTLLHESHRLRAAWDSAKLGKRIGEKRCARDGLAGVRGRLRGHLRALVAEPATSEEQPLHALLHLLGVRSAGGVTAGDGRRL